MAYVPVYTSANDVYGRTGLSSSEVDFTTGNNIDLIEDAERELETLTGRKWTNGNAVTEYIDGTKKDIIGYAGNNVRSINLNHYPVQSITEFKQLDSNMNAMKTYATLTSVQITAGTLFTTDYWLEVTNDPVTNSIVPYGKVVLVSDVFNVGHMNIKVGYTYGYATVPTLIRTLATCLAGVRSWIFFLGGNYNRLDSYSIPQQSVSKGNFYSRGLQNIESLKAEAEKILDRVGYKPRTLFVAYSGDK